MFCFCFCFFFLGGGVHLECYYPKIKNENKTKKNEKPKPKTEVFEPRTATGSDFGIKSDVARHRPQVKYVKTEVLPSVLNLQKRDEKSRFYEH